MHGAATELTVTLMGMVWNDIDISQKLCKKSSKSRVVSNKMYCKFQHFLHRKNLSCRMYAPSVQHVPHSACTLHWRHNERDSVLNYRRLHCLLNRLFRRRSKKTSKLRVTGLCAGNSAVTGEFPAQRASDANNPFDDVTMSCQLTGTRPWCLHYLLANIV